MGVQYLEVIGNNLSIIIYLNNTIIHSTYVKYIIMMENFIFVLILSPWIKNIQEFFIQEDVFVFVIGCKKYFIQSYIHVIVTKYHNLDISKLC